MKELTQQELDRIQHSTRNAVWVDIDKIKPYENNPRINKKAVEKVKESILRYGFNVPITVDKDGVIATGHTRYQAALELGLKKVLVIYLDDLSEDEIKAWRLVDNRTNEYAEWDMDKLNVELKELAAKGFELETFDFEIKEEKVEIVEDDFDPVLPPTPRCVEGDIFQLGEHRLMVGDSTIVEHVKKLVGGGLIDTFFSDPPYNVNVHNSEDMTIANDNLPQEVFDKVLDDAFKNASKVMKDGATFFIWHGDSQRVQFQTKLEKHGLIVKQCLIWVKNGFNFGRQDFKWMHEPCLYGWKEGAGHYFVSEFNHPTVKEDLVDLDKMKKEELIKLVEQLMKEDEPGTVIHENKPLKNDLHPTMKPLTICASLIRLTTRKNETVLDLFGGSGSTLIACEQLGRKCLMMEMDPFYASVILDRWEKFTGKKAVRIND